MKPAAFDYVRAESIEEATGVLAEEGIDASVLAGGQTLIPLLSMRMARPRVVIDIMQLPGLDRIEIDDGTIRVGATVRQCTLERQADLTLRQPLLAAALPWVGHTQHAVAALFAAQWHMPIRARSCRSFWWRLAAKLSCGPGDGHAGSPPKAFSPASCPPIATTTS